MGMLKGGGMSLSFYFDLGPAEYNSATLISTFSFGGGLDFEIPLPLPLPVPPGLVSLIGGGSIYVYGAFEIALSLRVPSVWLTLAV